MKKNNILWLSTILLVMFSGCEKKLDSEGISRISYFAEIVINGESYMIHPGDEPFIDPGATAYENGVEIEVETQSDIDLTNPGPYKVFYTAVNTDGFPHTVFRNVNIYDPDVSTEDHEGVYNASIVRTMYGEQEAYTDNAVTLTAIEGYEGLYEIDDWMAGFYADENGRGWGEEYRFSGIIQINATDEIVMVDMSNIFGVPFDGNEVEGIYDPVTGNISYSFTLDDETMLYEVELEI